MRFSRRVKLIAGFLLPVAMMLGGAILHRRALDETITSTEWVVHTDRVISLANTMMTQILDGQAALRAHLVSAEGADRYNSSLEQASLSITELTKLVADNREQTARVLRISVLHTRWRDEIGNPLINAPATNDQNTTQEHLLRMSDSKILPELRRVFSELVSTEEQLLRLRQRASRESVERAQRLELLLPAVASIFAVALSFYLSSGIARSVQEIVRSATRFARGELDVRIQKIRGDELGVLAESFNEMAETLTRRDREKRILASLTEDLHSCITFEETFQRVRRFATELSEKLSGNTYLVRSSRNLIELVFHWGDETPKDDVFTPDQCWALRRGKPHLYDPASKGAICMHAEGIKRSLCIPLLAHGETLGVWHIANWDSNDEEEHRALIQQASEQLSLAAANLQLRNRLRDQSIRDPLTGLFNRRYLEESLVREIARAQRQRRIIGILLFDVDHFKRFNDTHGHDAGDTVLREIGALLKRGFRSSDIACRFGGEEFVLVLPDTEPAQVMRSAERLREGAMKLNVVHNGAVLGQVTISVGVALYPTIAETPEQLLRQADVALYRAKMYGRNRVCLADFEAENMTSSEPPEPAEKTEFAQRSQS